MPLNKTLLAASLAVIAASHFEQKAKAMTPTDTTLAPLDSAALDKLEALARAATPGPWSWWTSNSMLRLTGADGKDGGVLCPHYYMGHADLECSPADQAFIAAANPAMILALIAQARAAQQQQATPAHIPADEREKFEAWVRTLDVPGDALNRWPDGRYIQEPIEGYWGGWQARAAITQEAVAPAGYKLVPDVPTDAMRYAYERDAASGRLDAAGYRAMLDAAPAPSASGDEREAMDAARLSNGYESGFFSSSPQDGDGQFTLHYKSAAQAEAAYMLVTSIIDAALAAKSAGKDGGAHG